jgi:hypothetical protein
MLVPLAYPLVQSTAGDTNLPPRQTRRKDSPEGAHTQPARIPAA